ncbi:hypothetical protein [Legionella tunisiensis]|uniref:hypothetical protein n=1 Tax=Legionella tunisiensis TaxID=1034944 RepID=UPI000304A4BF|nr:hypothetical protein [Legionella tunisiensis]
MEIFSLVSGDHSFVVLGRDLNSDLQDMSTWGPNAVVLDPWLNSVFNVKEELQQPEKNNASVLPISLNILEVLWQKIEVILDKAIPSVGLIIVVRIMNLFF